MSGELEFAESLAKVQAELPHIGKDNSATIKGDKGSYSYTYADLTTISDAVLPLLTGHGFSFTAAPTIAEHGFVLRYALLHSGGHERGGDYPLPDPSKSTPQQIGSAITYGRRYCLCAVTGIAPGGEDDDGVKATDARSTTHRTVVADKALAADLDARILLATDEETLRGLYVEVDKANADGRITDDNRSYLVALITNRKDEVAA